MKYLKVIVCLGVMVLCLFGCKTKKEFEKPEDFKPKVEELDIKSSIVEELYEMSDITLCPFETEPHYYHKDYTLVLEDPFMTKELFNKELIVNQCNNSCTGFDKEHYKNGAWYWSYEVASSSWKKLFGSTSEINPKGVYGTLTENEYSQTFLSLGDACGPSNDYVSNIVRATKDEKEISIYESILFTVVKSQCNPNDCDYFYQYYFDKDRTQLTTESNRIANYRRIFKKDTDGHYYFYAIERLI